MGFQGSKRTWRRTRVVLEGIDSVCLLELLLSGCGGNLQEILIGVIRDMAEALENIRPGYRSTLFP